MSGTPVRTRTRPSALAAELDRLLADVAGSVDGVIAHPHPSPDSLHELHREMRRLRHALAIWERLLPSRDRETVRPLDQRLKRLARLVGRIRDRDVMIELIEGTSLPRPSRRDAPSVGRLRGRLRDDARTGRELLRVYLRSERDAHLFEGLRESVEFVARGGVRLTQLLDQEQVRRHRDVRTAHRRARRRSSSTRLHRLRIQVRRLRHLGEVRRHLDRPKGATFPPAMRRLQSGLGRLHDLDLVLGGLDSGLRSTEWGRALRKERRRVRRSIQESVRALRWPSAPAPRSTSPGRSPRRAAS